MKRRVLAAFGITAAVLIALASTLYFWVQSSATRRWEEFQAQGARAFEAAKFREPRRPVLRGTPTPGNAWDDYDLALAAMTGSGHDTIRAFVEFQPNADVAKTRAMVQANLPALALLGAGASREQGAFLPAGLPGMRVQSSRTGPIHALILLALARGRLLAEDGDAGAARDVLLDAVQFSFDSGRNSTLLMHFSSQELRLMCLDELRILPSDPALSRALAAFDAGWPDQGAAMNQFSAHIAESYRRFEVNPMFTFLETWRCGFSRRLMQAEAGRVSIEVAQRSAEALRGSWAESRRVSVDLQRRLGVHWNPAVQASASGIPWDGRSLFEARAKLRLLRRYHGETAELDDPFGGKIHDDGRRIWSAGPDGVDDGGRGDWKPSSSGDIVLERPK